eukprot:391244-Alexandrium_andersonii.AAC.1
MSTGGRMPNKRLGALRQTAWQDLFVACFLQRVVEKWSSVRGTCACNASVQCACRVCALVRAMTSATYA